MTLKSPTVSVLARNTNNRKAVPAFIAHPSYNVPKATPALTIVTNTTNMQSIPARAIVVTPTGTGTTKSGSFVKSAKQVNILR